MSILEGTFGNQLAHMREELASLAKRVDQFNARLADDNDDRRIRVGKTTTSSSYPTSPADTYEVVLVEGTFTETPGDQTATYTNRQTSAYQVAHNPEGTDIPEGTVIFVVRDNQRWWIVTPVDQCKVKVNGSDTCDYLEDQFTDSYGESPAAGDDYNATQDFEVAFKTIDIGGGDREMRGFVDASKMPGYDAAKDQALYHDVAGVPSWIDIETCPSRPSALDISRRNAMAQQ